MRSGVSLTLALSACLSILAAALPQPALVLRAAAVDDHHKPKYSVVPLEPGPDQPGGGGGGNNGGGGGGGGGSGGGDGTVTVIETLVKTKTPATTVTEVVKGSTVTRTVPTTVSIVNITADHKVYDDESCDSIEPGLKQSYYLEGDCQLKDSYFNQGIDCCIYHSIVNTIPAKYHSSRHLIGAASKEYSRYNYHINRFSNPNCLAAVQLYCVVFLGGHNRIVEHCLYLDHRLYFFTVHHPRQWPVAHYISSLERDGLAPLSPVP
ncbi:uncharacterized protein TRIREDRAFT_120453 [Trichoderma reesei QM6a]|uniref:Predicted protein n=1 Tax=Hypocrea jecorina (strain QM6a) TaxID=431241 RepID=G0RCF9_HYPJQ|nr:uncharacterized protein TRIREDRAFT_120453 [Trichoderma reesei QM6a]EGR51218.1 predicted protein [Trichoderma reesei QM6a]